MMDNFDIDPNSEHNEQEFNQKNLVQVFHLIVRNFPQFLCLVERSVLSEELEGQVDALSRGTALLL